MCYPYIIAATIVNNLINGYHYRFRYKGYIIKLQNNTNTIFSKSFYKRVELAF